jgi:hypothetical protein
MLAPHLPFLSASRMDLPQENAGKDSPTYTMGSVTPAKGPSFFQDWTGPNENNDISLDGIVSNTIVREPDQHGLEMDKQREAGRSSAPHWNNTANVAAAVAHLASIHPESDLMGAPPSFAQRRPHAAQLSSFELPPPPMHKYPFLNHRHRIISNTTVREPDQHDREMDEQRIAHSSDVLTAIISEEPLTEGGVTSIADCLESLGYPKSWCSNPRLYYIVHKMGRLDLFPPKILDAEITDLWLPLHKRLVRKWMNDTDTRTFIKYQEFVLDENIPVSLQGRHFTLDNMDQLDLRRIMFLGAGGFGEVHSVQYRGNGQVYACKTMARPVRFDAHAEMMRNFKREIMGMRRVHHRHCVDLIASCTDTDSVTILSHPVADSGDLSTFLDANLNLDQLKILRHSVGCITSALTYLHSLNIR